MKQSNHKVSVLHKMSEAGLSLIRRIKGMPTKEQALAALAVGQVFNFPKSGDRYRVMPTGAVVRVDPKPWRNKSERRQAIKARREVDNNRSNLALIT